MTPNELIRCYLQSASEWSIEKLWSWDSNTGLSGRTRRHYIIAAWWYIAHTAD